MDKGTVECQGHTSFCHLPLQAPDTPWQRHLSRIQRLLPNTFKSNVYRLSLFLTSRFWCISTRKDAK